MSDRASEPPSHRVRLGKLDRSRPAPVDLRPNADTCGALADELALSALRKLRLAGELTARGRADWQLDATLGATVVQPCGITLAPVTTRIDEPVARTYLADFPVAELPAEQEMPEDDSVEPLPDTLDLMSVLTEALMLAIPDFPRAPGAEMDDVTVSEPGTAPMSDADAKPFAGLRDALKKDDT